MSADTPSSQHRHRGLRAVQRLVEHAPASGGLALWARHRDLDADEAAALARRLAPGRADAARAPAPLVTDGRTLGYAPAFEALPLPLQTGWVAHAVLHVALRHAQRAAELQRRLGAIDLALFNLCADAIVNTALAHHRWLALPPGALLLEDVLVRVLGVPAAQAEPAAALQAWDVERLYRAVDDRRARTPATGLRGTAGGPLGGAERPGGAAVAGGGAGETGRADGESAAPAAPETPTARLADGPRAAQLRQLGVAQAPDLAPAREAAESPEDEAVLAREWTERLLRAHAGDGEGSLLRTLPADLPRVRTPWEQVLRTQTARALAQRPGLSWSRPARSWLANQGRAGRHGRLPWEPGTTASRAVPRLVLVVDVSGSIDAALLARFAAEVEALRRRLEADLVLIEGDAAVQRVRTLPAGGRARLSADGLALRGTTGGGGTDFTPLLEEAGRHRPDLTVVLTDLDGPARHRPPGAVLWTVPAERADVVAPFGRVLVLR